MDSSATSSLAVLQNNFRILYIEDFSRFYPFFPGYISLVPEITHLSLKIVNIDSKETSFYKSPFSYKIVDNNPVLVTPPTSDALELISALECKLRVARKNYGIVFYEFNRLNRDPISATIHTRVINIIESSIAGELLSNAQKKIIDIISTAHAGKSLTDILQELRLEENIKRARFDSRVAEYLKSIYEDNLA